MLDYTHICHIFKLKSLNGMLKYRVKMFLITTPPLIQDENIIFKYIMIKLYYFHIIFDFLLSFFPFITMLLDW